MLAEFPGNPARGLPYLSGLMILNDSETGTVKAILNGGALTAMRTGAVGGVGVRYLAGKDNSSLGIVGCGTQGFHQILFACAARPIRDVYLYDRFVSNLQPFADRVQKRLKNPSIQIHICKDVKELIENSEILISATQAAEPVYPDDENLLEGKCFIALGSWMPERRELPDAVSRLAQAVYTDLPYACEESGDLKIPLATGVLDKTRVKYMEDLISDTKSGKPHSHAATRCFKTVGMGIFDVRVAQLIYERAAARGIGQEVNW